MIRQTFYMDRYDWTVYAYYAVDDYYTDEIVELLYDVGCRGSDLVSAEKNLSSGNLDTGLTYSNFDTHETVMVIAMTSSALEFAKSWRHEMGHLGDHISQTYGFDPHGEEIQYIGDGIVGKMWKVAKKFLCESCRSKNNL